MVALQVACRIGKNKETAVQECTMLPETQRQHLLPQPCTCLSIRSLGTLNRLHYMSELWKLPIRLQ